MEARLGGLQDLWDGGFGRWGFLLTGKYCTAEFFVFSDYNLLFPCAHLRWGLLGDWIYLAFVLFCTAADLQRRFAAQIGSADLQRIFAAQTCSADLQICSADLQRRFAVLQEIMCATK